MGGGGGSGGVAVSFFDISSLFSRATSGGGGRGMKERTGGGGKSGGGGKVKFGDRDLLSSLVLEFSLFMGTSTADSTLSLGGKGDGIRMASETGRNFSGGFGA